ncbi:MAG: site-2 protease family protein [Firmicutes bacterium]|nr:site-2 protease family protein [Bacillota bacterium]
MIFSIFSAYNGWAILLALLAFVLAILVALVLHEWAHAWAAFKSGDPTAKLMGRMSLNPRAHVEPMGLMMFMIVGIGWAKPVPVNPFNYRNFKRGNFFVSVAGVTVNFILGFLFSLGYFLVYTYANMDIGIWFFLGTFFMFGTFINIALMIFNLLPVPPLDGYNMLVSITKPNNRYMQWARNNAMVLLLTILVISMLTGGIMHLRDGIIGLFNMLWGAIF